MWFVLGPRRPCQSHRRPPAAPRWPSRRTSPLDRPASHAALLLFHKSSTGERADRAPADDWIVRCASDPSARSRALHPGKMEKRDIARDLPIERCGSRARPRVDEAVGVYRGHEVAVRRREAGVIAIAEAAVAGIDTTAIAPWIQTSSIRRPCSPRCRGVVTHRRRACRRRRGLIAWEPGDQAAGVPRQDETRRPTALPRIVDSTRDRFDWWDAAVGAAAGLGLLLVVVGGQAAWARRGAARRAADG